MSFWRNFHLRQSSNVLLGIEFSLVSSRIPMLAEGSPVRIRVKRTFAAEGDSVETSLRSKKSLDVSEIEHRLNGQRK